MDEGLFWGFFAASLVFVLLPFFMRGQKWAVVSFFGAILGIFLINTLTVDGSVGVAYASCPGSTISTCFNTVTNGINLPVTFTTILVLFGFFVTVAKGLDKI